MGERKVREEAVCCTGMQPVNYHITTADGVCVCLCVCVFETQRARVADERHAEVQATSALVIYVKN